MTAIRPVLFFYGAGLLVGHHTNTTHKPSNNVTPRTSLTSNPVNRDERRTRTRSIVVGDPKS